MKYTEYISGINRLKALLCDTWHMLDHADDLDNKELECLNKRLYSQILPESYKDSYVNPTFAVSSFGTEEGRFLSAFIAELRAAIPSVYERDEDGLNSRLTLADEVIHLLQEADKNDKAAGADAFRELFYAYYRANCLREIKKKLSAQLLPGRSLIRFNIASESLNLRSEDIIRKMYLCGEYVTENETALAKILCALPDEELMALADTFTGGYFKGFEVTGRDLSIKDTVDLRFNIGFIPMMIASSRIFEKHDLSCTMVRAGYSIFTGREVEKNGLFGANPNPQYDLDHKNDLSLILDEDLNAFRIECLKQAFEELKEHAKKHAGPAVVDIFGEPEFIPENKPEATDHDEKSRKLVTEYSSAAGAITNEYIPGDERSFTIIAYPMPSIAMRLLGESASDEEKAAKYAEIFDATMRINNLDYVLYRDIQQKIIDVLDKAEFVRVKGSNDNKTDLKIYLHDITDPSKETKFENCVADVNIPVGEVFTSPVLECTGGVLHVTHVYLNGIEYHDLSITVEDGMIKDYSCIEGRKLMDENILFHHDTLPMGEFAIGTNTTAYVLARKLKMESMLPILIAEKTGPHFAFGDTCYSHSEDLKVYNPDGKEIIARDNSCSILRKTEPEKAYFNCHTDITIPYDELGELVAVSKDGTEVTIISEGRFVLDGCEELNRPFS